MYPGADTTEYVSVVGTDAFMDFVESIQSEGVELERKANGRRDCAENPDWLSKWTMKMSRKDIEKLDIEIPVTDSREFIVNIRILKNLDLSPVWSPERSNTAVHRRREQRRSSSKTLPRVKSIIPPTLIQRHCRLPQCDRIFHSDHHERFAPGEWL